MNRMERKKRVKYEFAKRRGLNDLLILNMADWLQREDRERGIRIRDRKVEKANLQRREANAF